jgi:hypothetical protein
MRLYLMRPNASGKPRRSAKRGGHQQLQAVGVGLTNMLGLWRYSKLFALLNPLGLTPRRKDAEPIARDQLLRPPEELMQ